MPDLFMDVDADVYDHADTSEGNVQLLVAQPVGF